MPETIKITPGIGLTIKYSGAFDFDKLYKEMHDWFVMHKYDFNEKEHTKKERETGNYVEINWAGDKKIDDYAQFSITVHIIIENMAATEGIDSGNLAMELVGNLVLDYNNRWQSKPFNKFLIKIYNNYIIKDKINKQYIEKLYEEITNLQDTAKSILGLYS